MHDTQPRHRGAAAGLTVDAPVRRPSRAVEVGYVVLALVLAGYGASVALRGPGHYEPWLDTVLVPVVEVAACVLAVHGAVVARTGRTVARGLAAGLVLWVAGDLIWHTMADGGPVPAPAPGDLFYLCAYPCLFVAVVALLGRRPPGALAGAWLDGLLAALGTAAVVLAAGLGEALRDGWTARGEVVVNLLYPVGDLVVLSLAVGALAVLSSWTLQGLLLVAGAVVLGWADVMYLLGSADGTYVQGTWVDLAWPVAVLLLSAAAHDRCRDVHVVRHAGASFRLVLPLTAALLGTGVMVRGAVGPGGTAQASLVSLMLGVAVVRIVVLLREVRSLEVERAVAGPPGAGTTADAAPPGADPAGTPGHGHHHRVQAERLQGLLDAAPVGIVERDVHGIVVRWNAAAEQIYGWTAAEVVGTPGPLPVEVAPGPGRAVAPGASAVVVEPTGDDVLLSDTGLGPGPEPGPPGGSGEPWATGATGAAGAAGAGGPTDGPEGAAGPVAPRVERHRRKDGTVVDVEVAPAAVVDTDGEYAGTVTVVFDVGRRTELELLLRHSQKMESIGQLASGVAHEINTPIQFIGDDVRFLQESFTDLARLCALQASVIESIDDPALEHHRGQVRTLRDEIDLDFLLSDTPAAIDQALEGIERVATVVRAMRSMGRPGGSTRSLVDVNQCIADVLVVAAGQVDGVARLEVRPGELPPLMCNPGDVQQVLLNLVVNAAQAVADSAPRADTGLITVTTRHEHGAVVVEVTDDGCGIAPDVAPRVFDPFFTTRPVGSGRGQGLAVAHALVTDMPGGTLTFTSTPGEGTTFVVRLPVPADPGSDPDDAPGPGSGAGPGAGPGPEAGPLLS